MKFRKKPVVIEATQWFKNGDHPLDNVMRPFEDTCKVPIDPREGAVVRYFRDPGRDGKDYCSHCHLFMHNHGWIDTLEGGHIVCPGDWIITGVKGEHYPCKSGIFIASYEMVDLKGDLTSEEQAEVDRFLALGFEEMRSATLKQQFLCARAQELKQFMVYVYKVTHSSQGELKINKEIVCQAVLMP